MRDCRLSLVSNFPITIVDKVAKYVNGLRYDIQDELSLVSPTSVHESYQYALREEEIIHRRHNIGGKYGTRGR